MDCHLCRNHYPDQDAGEIVWTLDAENEPTEVWICLECLDTVEECVDCHRRWVIPEPTLIRFCSDCRVWWCELCASEDAEVEVGTGADRHYYHATNFAPEYEGVRDA